MGGIAKGQIVREIDALGGYSGIVTDLSTIQFRMLNKSKGPAMWSPRSQNDRHLFASKWREMLENTPNVDFYQDSVNELIIKNNKACGVITSLGHKIEADAVIITSGTFLNGIIHIGEKQIGGGRVAEKAASGITEQLVSFGLESDRLKTGTPPRVDGRSLDYSKMEEQKGDEEIVGFSYMDIPRIKAEDQRSCHITYTDSVVHDILRTGFDRSPMYQGRIGGVGPRYCPSIEDKINRFADRERHQLFVEPEGWNTVEIYVNGFSTSLPEEVQYEALRRVPGFEKARMFRPGYAIEYDYFQPTQLTYTLETKAISNLYFAGQINGTTGYEEAACQGIMAGMNAHLKINEKEPLILKRSDAYIGVLIDDLISKGTNEPYRMFTSRAEFRTLLRQDNADLRLTELSHKLGFASADRLRKVEEKTNEVANIKTILSNQTIIPEEVNSFLTSIDSMEITEKQKASKLLLRPNISLNQVIENCAELKEKLIDKEVDHLEQAEIQIKYERYIEKEKEIVERMLTLENKMIPDNFDYDKLVALSIEALQKFKKIRPLTIGQASRISGVNPSDIQILMVFIGR
jgi:tRNA uridine 5-carboxymethylaminomethyl modification enzyme